MSLIDTLSNITGTTLNRYQLDFPSYTAPLDVEDFCGTEILSQLYRYDISFTSTDRNVDASQLLNKPATLTMGAVYYRALPNRSGCTAWSRILSTTVCLPTRQNT